MKVKKELLLSDEFLLDALTWEGINHRFPVSLPKEIAEKPFTRRYISNMYGGGTEDTFPHPRKDLLDLHGFKHWAFLSLEYNPHAPTKPGHSGLFFKSERALEGWREEVMRIFVRFGPAKWVYMGQYKMQPGISLTA